MSKFYFPIVIHHSATPTLRNTPGCRYVKDFSYIEENQDVAWFNNKRYFELFGKKRGVDHKNKLLAIVCLKYKGRKIRRRYKCDQTLRLGCNQIGLTSESCRCLFDDMRNISQEEICVSKGTLYDVFMYYWNHPFHATRISCKIGMVSLSIGIISLILCLISLFIKF